MYDNILSLNQKKLLPFIESFCREYYLVGGTAIALQKEICDATEAIFGSLFSTKLFKQQLCYFDDIDYQEEVAYCQTPVADEVVKKYLINIATLSM